jgi:hypothetical protein
MTKTCHFCNKDITDKPAYYIYTMSNLRYD